MQTDSVIISELRLVTRIGTTQEERATPQEVTISVEMFIPLREAADTKNLSASICYKKMKEDLEQFVTSKEWVLLEELAEEIAQKILAASEKIEMCDILVKKFIFLDCDFTGVKIRRAK